MNENIIAEHIAAFILEQARRSNGSVEFFVSELPEQFDSWFGFKPTQEAFERAIEIIALSNAVEEMYSPLTEKLYLVHYDRVGYYFDPDSRGHRDDLNYSEDRDILVKTCPVLVTYFRAGEAWLNRVREPLISAVESGDFDFSSEADWTDSADLSAPASDRIVAISDNEIKNIEEPLAEIISEISSSNVVGDRIGDEKERLLSELDAGKRLLLAGRVRLAAIKETLISAMKYIAKTFAGEALGQAAEAFIKALRQVLGI